MRRITMGLVSALLAALVAEFVWALLFAEFTDVPASSAYPPDWASLPPETQDRWLIEHSIRVSGFAAVARIFRDPSAYAAVALGFLALLFLCALGALGINAVLQRRAP